MKCNKFTKGDRLDKSVESFIEQSPHASFIVRKLSKGFEVAAVGTKEAPAQKPITKEKENARIEDVKTVHGPRKRTGRGARGTGSRRSKKSD
ncbi:hypothetical protein KAR91_63625 [Candidatus Pacearchaeota archaeon]|nr:hypothetical protein [Candidatus Pacearchaeota archaeon]